MIVYDLEVLTADDNLVTFDRGYLYHHNDEDFQSWEVELLLTNDDSLIQSLMDKQEHVKLKMGTTNGQSFIGMSLITKYKFGPLGSEVLLTGSGELREV
ncbi:hypothetical protein [Bacillus sp. ISL-37]|uniref:hypothetical protein n=1 Tax=Bacillus sp. ISL-37 TaxID=2819123 RepID=UPI001BEA2D1D|nr:hypothetical protein [Bacillus sp. ISL-37]MBT2682649.1 hypothetical protein [Bacillus sp. ISL-37]